MSDTENWLRLAKLESPKKAIDLVDYFGSPEAVFEARADELAQVDGITKRMVERIGIIAKEPVDDKLRAMEKLNARMITYRDPEYPRNIRQIYDPPAVLFVMGDIVEEDRFAVAIIGTRVATEYGKSMAVKISKDLAKRGLCVVSGGARGIDTAAHTAAVQVGGRTIAVLGSGLDVVYPPENRGLFARIAQSGAVISEFVPGTRPDAWRFPARNRLVSGLSLGVLVIESKISGGAMITATHAAEQGRDVWALPGGTDSVVSEGPHRLIKEGAKLIESADDILEELGIEPEEIRREKQAVPRDLSPEQQSIIQVLNLHPKHIDEIIQECRLTPATANSALTLLEMLGLVRRVPGNAYVRTV